MKFNKFIYFINFIMTYSLCELSGAVFDESSASPEFYSSVLIMYEDALNHGLKIWCEKPQNLKRAYEDMALLKRHNDRVNMFFSPCLDDRQNQDIPYQLNPFDASLKREKISYQIMGKLFDDPVHGPMVIETDHQAEEKRWAKNTVETIAKKMYQQCILEKQIYFKKFGSLAHQGFVQTDFHDIEKMAMALGAVFDIDTFKKQYFYTTQIPYTREIHNMTINRLYKYCEKMFNVEKQDILEQLTQKKVHIVLEEL